MNRKRLVVVLESKLHIHDLTSLKPLMVVHTEQNPRGLCALSPNNENFEQCFMAYPNSSSEGEVTVYDMMGMQIQTMVSAHQGTLANMAFSLDGCLLATASETGTLIRVFDSHEGVLLFSFRRGSTSTLIYGLSFSLNSEFLCASSDHGTVHIFRLDAESRMEERNSSVGLLGGMVGSVLPDSLSTVMDPRAFAQVKLRDAGVPNLCAMTADNSLVHVITADAYFLQYELPVEGGECKLVKESKLCLLYTSDAADEEDSVDLGGRRIIKKKKTRESFARRNSRRQRWTTMGK
eukprot:TRINITY_DN56095_c0_g1_i1.p1 TRINITY_DN56095_c0_g1~~TRINITY_DN56095_c0_g1_i1.p1  ORF type:complete len:292 (-),score=64.01 TRINITY_DN56095_c0_g1_i1:50-925(-)